MKKLILIALAALTVTVSAPSAGAWFGHEDTQKFEQQIQELKQKSNGFEAATLILGVTCIVALVVGTAIGSRGRRNAKPTE